MENAAVEGHIEIVMPVKNMEPQTMILLCLMQLGVVILRSLSSVKNGEPQTINEAMSNAAMEGHLEVVELLNGEPQTMTLLCLMQLGGVRLCREDS